MERTTVIFGSLLIIIGVGGYILSGMVSITAMIPAFFGVIFVILGMLASKENLKKHMMHAAAALSIILIIPTITAIGDLVAGDSSAAVISRSITAIASIIFLMLCVKSFIDARRARDAAA